MQKRKKETYIFTSQMLTGRPSALMPVITLKSFDSDDDGRLAVSALVWAGRRNVDCYVEYAVVAVITFGHDTTDLMIVITFQLGQNALDALMAHRCSVVVKVRFLHGF